MPELPPAKIRPRTSATTPSRVAAQAWAELEVTTNFSFLTGASHPEELVQRAAELGYRALAVTDRNTLAGIVRAHVAAKETGLALVVGCRIVLTDAPDVLVHCLDRAGYARLCRLLTLGKRRAAKGECTLALADLLEHAQGLLATAVPPRVWDSPDGPGEAFAQAVRRLASAFDGDRLSIAATHAFGPDDRGRLARTAALARACGVPLVATSDVHYHVRARRALQDVLVCVRAGCTIEQAGFRLHAHAERHLKAPEEQARLFAGYPAAIARALELAERALAFSLDELRYQYPEETCPSGVAPIEHLRALTLAGAAERYPAGVPDKVLRLLEHELELVRELDYARYFLTVHDLVAFARSRGILCQGRGAAANSAVCYCLGVTSVDPDRIDLLFERFVSKERDEPPDIDIDFEHERREEVIQYLYAKYGRERAALTAEVISYRGKSALRDVGKALGLTQDCLDALARDLDWWHGGVGEPERLRALGLDPDDPTMRRLFALSSELLGFPRHLSQHVGGFVMTKGPLCELVPIENAAMPERTVIEWDKDDIDALGMLKVDVLALGMLTALRKTLDLVRASGEWSGPDAWARGSLALHTIPPEDPAVYEMISRADTVGVFQIESRAQMSMLPRLRPRVFYDLVIEVAIVRPGPIHGRMVHPYLRRRNGEEPVSYPSEAVRRVLGKTLGVPLFQEQAMSLAIVAAGFTAGEADQLRRAMAAWKRKGNLLAGFRDKLVGGMRANGYTRDFAERFYEQLQGFSEYGFPESHAASFALIVYVSAWLKRYHPAAFTAALLNSQPMGFYAPAQLVRDAREHGVEVRPVDVGHSDFDCTLEPGEQGPALRLGQRLVKGLREEDARAVALAVRERGPFDSVLELARASGVRAAALRRLASADAFRSMGLDRTRALWEVRALAEAPASRPRRTDERTHEQASLPFPALPSRARLPETPLARQVLRDLAAMRLSLKAHPLSFLRGELAQLGAVPAAALADLERFPHGRSASVAGIVLVRQRPGTAGGIVFMTIEDESGSANLVVRPAVFERYREAARHSVVLLARGRVERASGVVHLVARELESLDVLARELAVRSRDFH